MSRLTMDNLEQMGMYNLAHNCCYVGENRAVRYRDFDTDIDAREFARKLMVAYGKWKSCEEHGLDADNEMVDDGIFDDTMLDNLMYEPTEIEGLIALFYRNLWGMAELREKLKSYEDTEGKNLIDVDKYVDELKPVLENMREENPECTGVQIMEYCIGVADAQERVR